MQSHTFLQANATILTGFHSASLRHSFTSVAFSPPAAHYFARRLSPLRLRSLSAALITMPLHMAHSYLISPCSTKLPCIVRPPTYPDGKFTSVASYGAGIGLLRRPFLPAPRWGLAAAFVRSSLRRLTAARLQRFSADKFAAQTHASY